MLARVLKTNSQQPAPSSQAPTTPTKSSSRAVHTKSQSSSATSSPSKIPVASNQSRSAFVNGNGAKENNPAPPPAHQAERSNYLSFLFSQSQTGAPTTPVKVNKAVTQASIPTHGDHAHANRVYGDDDVHMQTMKNTINPNMLKQLASIPVPPAVPRQQPAAGNPYAIQRNGHLVGSEDVHMRTARLETMLSEKEQSHQLWEEELLEQPDVKRKATVAQICEPRAYSAEPS